MKIILYIISLILICANISYSQTFTFYNTKQINQWVLSGAYNPGDYVENNGMIFKENATIPANTAFVQGFTGATWYNLSYGGVYAMLTTAQEQSSTARINANYASTDMIIDVGTQSSYSPTFASEVAGSAITIKKGTTIRITKIL